MHRVSTARLLHRALRIGEHTSTAVVPVFLCPAVSRGSLPAPIAFPRPTRRFHGTDVSTRTVVEAEAVVATEPAVETEPAFATEPAVETPPVEVEKALRKLPVTCSGCGAFSQSTDSQQLGYFDIGGKRVRNWLHPRKYVPRNGDAAEDKIVDDVLKGLDPERLKALGLNVDSMIADEASEVATRVAEEKPPVCDRCHDLIHHSTAADSAKVMMHHPTVESLRETIEESPYKYNHIYHIIDAADFPMSLIPRLNVLLGDIPLRSKNRRSRSGKFQHDRKTEMSFIVTRGDLLGPTKEIVDSMMPYLRDVLREALGRVGGRVRLGNLKCVSAKRSWWTTDVKEDIWHRGGAGWMVGKVNVGKSQLFEAVYPKGRVSDGKKLGKPVSTYSQDTDDGYTAENTWEDLDVGELLPPPQPVQNYPAMPVVSSLPGTTASPIRVPFGNGKGELIDLPGLARSDLDLFVQETHRQSLIMKKRIVPEQVSVKLGKSLLLGGGLIRITPRTPDMIFLMYNFTPIAEHLTMTEKAIGFQDQTRQSAGVENISLPGVGEKMKHAGTFKLCHDVTKKRAGPLTRKNAVGLQVDRLPFRVVSVDILIEGVGYVEIVAQVRARDFERWERMQGDVDRDIGQGEEGELAFESEEKVSKDPFEEMMRNRKDSSGEVKAVKVREPLPEPDWPAVDVFTPEGRFVGSRQPINGWLNNKPRVLPEHKKSRPRRSMRGVKKMGKMERRGE